jgi:hypothetical protein
MRAAIWPGAIGPAMGALRLPSRLGFAAVAGLVLLSTLPASGSPAASPPLVRFHPSYALYGGVPVLGSRILLASGNATNLPPIGPSFSDRNGKVHERIVSEVRGGYGLAEMVVRAGVQNLSFSCPSTCASSWHPVVIVWNLTDFGAVIDTCRPGVGVGWFSIGVAGEVTDLASHSGYGLVGWGFQTVWHLQLSIPGSAGASDDAQAVTLRFSANLTSGHHYTLESYIQEKTFVSSPGCYVRSEASVGYWGLYAASGPSYLRSLTVH